MIRAIIAGVAIAVIAPLIGTFLVVRRFSLIGDTLSHVALSGVAIGLLLGIAPIITTLAITILAAIAIEIIRTKQNVSGEAVLAMFLPGGLALSVVLLSIAKGFNSNLFSFLFGSISTVGTTDLMLILGLAALTTFIIFIFYKQLFFVAFDEEGAKVSGVKVKFVNLLLIVLTAVTVSLAMRIVGILLIGALLVIPVITAQLIAKSFKQALFLSVLIALFSVLAGLILAYYLSLPAGGVIVLLALLVFLITSILK